MQNVQHHTKGTVNKRCARTFIASSFTTALLAITVCILLSSCDTSEEKRLLKEGEKHLEAGNHTKAIELFTKAIESNNSYAKAFLLRGNAEFRAGAYQKAIDDISNGLSLDPKDRKGEWTYLRGCAYREIREYEIALSDFNAAIEKANKYLRSYELNSNPAFDAKQKFKEQLQKYYEERDKVQLMLESKR